MENPSEDLNQDYNIMNSDLRGTCNDLLENY